MQEQDGKTLCTSVTFCSTETRWMAVRESLSIQAPPTHPMMPSPSADGKPCVRALSATEAGDWLRKLLTGSRNLQMVGGSLPIV